MVNQVLNVKRLMHNMIISCPGQQRLDIRDKPLIAFRHGRKQLLTPSCSLSGNLFALTARPYLIVTLCLSNSVLKDGIVFHDSTLDWELTAERLNDFLTVLFRILLDFSSRVFLNNNLRFRFFRFQLV